MGNKLLIIALSALFAWSNSQYPEIDKLIEKVKVKREGLKSEEIKKLKNPFVSEKKLIKIIKKTEIAKKTAKKRVYYKLYSIFNDKAKINGRWYKIGSKVGSYRLVSINSNSVLLRKRNRQLRLYLSKRKRKLIHTINWR